MNDTGPEETRSRRNTIAAIALLFVLLVVGTSFYQVVDLFGTLHHYWAGNTLSVAFVSTMEFYAPIALDSLTALVRVWFGLDEYAARMYVGLTMIAVALSISVTLLFFLVRRDIRDMRRKCQDTK